VRVDGPSAVPQEFPLNDNRVLAIEQYGAGPPTDDLAVDGSARERRCALPAGQRCRPGAGTVRRLGGLARVGDYRPVHKCGPLLGEHTGQVLGKLLGSIRGGLPNWREPALLVPGMEPPGPDRKGPERKEEQA
jgi:hypothetical protein